MSENLITRARGKLAHLAGRRAEGASGNTAELRYEGPLVKLNPEKVAGCEVLPDRYEALYHFPKGGLVAEVGTQRGLYARRILDACRPEKLYVIDLSYALFEDELFQKELAGGQLVKLEGYSDKVLDTFDDGSLDWIYIDASHVYEDVKKDVDVAIRKVKPTGFLVFNDYTLWSHLEMMSYGVVPAVNELCNSTDWKMRYFVMNHLTYYDVVLTRGNSPLD